MITYDLECADGHVFEGWFDNADGFKVQLDQGLLTCPICGSDQVHRRLSTFGIAKSRPHEGDKAEVPNPVDLFVKYVKDNFQDVGADFSREALKMHYGVTELRNIRGVSSASEEQTLKEEGVNFFKLPMPGPETEE